MSEVLSEGVLELVQEYSKVRRMITDTEAHLKTLEEQRREIEGRLFNWWEDVPKHLRPPHIQTPNGRVTFSVATRYGMEDLETFEAWRTANNVSATLLYRAHWQLLNAYCRERMESGEPLPEGVSTYDQQVIRFKR